MLDRNSESMLKIAQKDIRPKHRITRRDFLRWSGTAAAALAASPLVNLGATVQAQQPPDENRNKTEITYIPKKEVVDGIDVYGTQEQFETQTQIIHLYDYFEGEFRKEAQKKEFADAIPHTLMERFDRIEALLDRDKRYLHIVVGRSLYNSFLKEAQKGDLNFPQWVNKQIQEMNRMIDDLHPPSGLKTVVKRIVVVNDYFNPDNPDKTSLNTLPEAPWDIDAWDNLRFWTDVRTTSSYVGEIKEQNKKIKIDYGLIHEWFHSLYSLPDEYYLDIERTMGIPDFFVMGDGLQRDILPELSKMRRTPWVAACLNSFAKNNVRGRHRSKKSPGFSGIVENIDYDEIPENAVTIWSKRPESIKLNFINFDGKPIDGSVEIFTARFPEATTQTTYSGVKTINQLKVEQITNGSLDLKNEDFIGNQFADGSSIATTNFIFILKGKDGRVRTLHLPVTAFNMSAIAGKKDAVYTIQFLKDSLDEENKVQSLEMLNSSEITPALLRNNPPNVQMKVDGTDDYFYWYFSKGLPNRWHP